VEKQRSRPSEVDRPDVAARRDAFLEWMKAVDPKRLVFFDESGANLAMGRSHAWVMRGEEYVERRPMNWGDNLTLIVAIRLRGWVTLSTPWEAVKARTFVTWVRDRLAPRLRPGDIVLMDNLPAHKSAKVAAILARVGATLKFLPPDSPDFNPIEAVWALVKKYIRAYAPRTASTLRHVARAARHAVAPHHCPRFFAHAGYVRSSGQRG
jgi:transposase